MVEGRDWERGDVKGELDIFLEELVLEREWMGSWGFGMFLIFCVYLFVFCFSF